MAARLARQLALRQAPPRLRVPRWHLVRAYGSAVPRPSFGAPTGSRVHAQRASSTSASCDARDAVVGATPSALSHHNRHNHSHNHNHNRYRRHHHGAATARAWFAPRGLHVAVAHEADEASAAAAASTQLSPFAIASTHPHHHHHHHPHHHPRQHHTQRHPRPRGHALPPAPALRLAVRAYCTERPHKPQQRTRLERALRWLRAAPKHIREEVAHYVLGTKRLARNMRVSAGLGFRMLRGQSLTRRERRLLETTVADTLRLVPFLVLILIPFLEFAIPFLIKVFPNMLPSTYESSSQLEAKRKGLLQIRVEMAKFLQKATEKAFAAELADEATEEDFLAFMDKVKRGAYISNAELIRIGAAFGDVLSLERIGIHQLQAVCRFFGVMPYGPRTYLIYKLNDRLRTLREDDKLILAEGVEELSTEELVSANIARGMKVEGRDREMLELQLHDWMELTGNPDISPFMLLLSRSFVLTQEASAITAVLRGIDEDTLTTMAESLPDEDELYEMKQALDQAEDADEYEAAAEPMLAKVDDLKQNLATLREAQDVIEDMEDAAPPLPEAEQLADRIEEMIERVQSDLDTEDRGQFKE